MANHHFAKLGDVWKHLALCEILHLQRPTLYWESHAGSAIYEMTDDPERVFGALGFWERAQDSAVLARSRYLSQLRQLNQGDRLRTYPGSSLLAMTELGDTADYVLCDTDPASADDLRAWATRSSLSHSVRVDESDGPTALHGALGACDPDRLLVHIDPFDPWSRGPAGVSALGLVGEVADAGARVVYWYGYDRRECRAWALSELAELTRAPLWCGDILVTTTDPRAAMAEGDLGSATTSGTGFGVVCAHVSDQTLEQCDVLGSALTELWRGISLPDGTEGALDFSVRTRR
jgi:23S rRNA A2030 N6-methylase RlmJ